MLRTSLAIAGALYIALAVLLLRACSFLRPLRALIWQSYERPILCFSALLLLNLSAAVYTLVRRVALKDTGDKLAHLEKQLRGSSTMSRELSERILEER